MKPIPKPCVCELEAQAFNRDEPLDCWVCGRGSTRKDRTMPRKAKQATKETFTKSVDIELSDSEIDDYRHKLVDVVARRHAKKAEKLEADNGFNAELKEIRELEKSYVGAIRTGKASEEVEVYERQLQDRKVVQIVRADNHELVEERPMTAAELQGDFGFEDGAANDHEEDADGEEEDDDETEYAEGEARYEPGSPAPKGKDARVH